MIEFLLNYYFMPFNLSVIALLILSMAETIGIYIGLRPSTFLKKFLPRWLSNSPLVNVKFSKVLILVFFSHQL